ncbi:MAG: Bacterial regulatory protein tetR family [Actinomycetota bacterium]
MPKPQKKPASKQSSRLTPKIRTSKADAKLAIIKAVIKLLDTQPITDITTQEIAEEAGVNYTYINRYFVTIMNLYAEVTDTLADIARDKSFDTINKLIRKQKESPNKLSMAELEQTRLETLPIAIKRLWLVQYLVATGVPADRFVAKSKEAFESAIALAEQLGFDHATARTRIIYFITMTWIEASLTPVFGLTSEEINKAFAMTFTDAISNKPKTV